MAHQRQRLSRGASGKLGLPEDVLDAVLAFGDLRSLCAAATNTQFRDSFERSSTARRLVTRRFPILATVLAEADTRSPRELFLSQKQIFPETLPTRRRRHTRTPTTALTDYVFSLEVEFQPLLFPGPYYGRESLFTGLLHFSPGGDRMKVTIPYGAFERCFNLHPQYDKETFRFDLRIMASRRTDQGVLQFARLGQVCCEDYDTDDLRAARFYDMGAFDLEKEMGWVRSVMEDHDMHMDPEVWATWTRGHVDVHNPHPPSFVDVVFNWYGNEETKMTADEICLALEHLVTWA